jgi:hypothetical protein
MTPIFPPPRIVAAALVLLVAAAAPAGAADYDVGPGQPLAAVGDVPWATLEPGDHVRIHWRSTPYREKWVIDRAGTAEAPIVVEGVPGPNGERPVISGDGATTPAPLDFWNDERGLLKIGGSNVPADSMPAYLVIEGLELRAAQPAYHFTDDHGTQQTYAANAAALYVEKAQHLVVRDCVLTDAGNGLFIGAFDGDTRDITIEDNWIYGNGNVGSAYEHDTYTEALGIVYEGNRFGPLRPGALGNNLKDRSAGLVVRYNWIEGGNRELDLVDAEDSMVLVDDPSYRETFVYGNVLVEPDGAGNSQIAHYGGDSGDPTIYRKGTLYFYQNTVVSTRSGNTTLLRLSTNDEQADVRDNVLYVTASGDRLALLDGDGVLDLRRNWLKPGWVATHGTLTGVLDDDGTSVEGDAPGFVDAAAQDFRLQAASPAVDAAAPLAPAVLPDHEVLRQYRSPQSTAPRPVDGPLDLGAFETCTTPCPEPPSAALAAFLALTTLAASRKGPGSSRQESRRPWVS